MRRATCDQQLAGPIYFSLFSSQHAAHPGSALIPLCAFRTPLRLCVNYHSPNMHFSQRRKGVRKSPRNQIMELRSFRIGALAKFSVKSFHDGELPIRLLGTAKPFQRQAKLIVGV
jgi:hypothetical protein